MKRKGFTLVEIITVVIIIGILARIAAPIMSGMKAKTMCSEAIVGMNAIKAALRQYRVEFGTYPYNGGDWLCNLPPSSFPGLADTNMPADPFHNLNGTFFWDTCYYYDGINEIYCVIDPTTDSYLANSGKRASEVIAMVDTQGNEAYLCIGLTDSTATVYQENFSKSGYWAG